MRRDLHGCVEADYARDAVLDPRIIEIGTSCDRRVTLKVRMHVGQSEDGLDHTDPRPHLGGPERVAP